MKLRWSGRDSPAGAGSTGCCWAGAACDTTGWATGGGATGWYAAGGYATGCGTDGCGPVGCGTETGPVGLPTGVFGRVIGSEAKGAAGAGAPTGTGTPCAGTVSCSRWMGTAAVTP